MGTLSGSKFTEAHTYDIGYCPRCGDTLRAHMMVEGAIYGTSIEKPERPAGRAKVNVQVKTRVLTFDIDHHCAAPEGDDE